MFIQLFYIFGITLINFICRNSAKQLCIWFPAYMPEGYDTEERSRRTQIFEYVEIRRPLYEAFKTDTSSRELPKTLQLDLLTTVKPHLLHTSLIA